MPWHGRQLWVEMRLLASNQEWTHQQTTWHRLLQMTAQSGIKKHQPTWLRDKDLSLET